MMNKFENVDIIDSLRKIMNTNTKHYKSDFEHDAEFLKASAYSGNENDKHILFMSRPAGTWAFRDSEVFIKDKSENYTWQFYADQTPKDNILAYAVKITGFEDGCIKGNLYELDYKAHCAEVAANSVRLQPEDMRLLEEYIAHGNEFTAERKPPEGYDKLMEFLSVRRKSYENLKPANIEKHIAKLQRADIQRRIKTMTADEKDAHIAAVEMTVNSGKADTVSKYDMDLYKAIYKERSPKRPSIRKQLADAKEHTAKQQPQKSISKAKEGITI